MCISKMLLGNAEAACVWTTLVLHCLEHGPYPGPLPLRRLYILNKSVTISDFKNPLLPHVADMKM